MLAAVLTDVNLQIVQEFMKSHEFNSIEDFRGKSLPFFTTHTELVRMQRDAVDAKRRQRVGLANDAEWSGDGEHLAWCWHADLHCRHLVSGHHWGLHVPAAA